MPQDEEDSVCQPKMLANYQDEHMKTVRPKLKKERPNIPPPTESNRTETVDFDLTKMTKNKPSDVVSRMETAKDVSLSFEMSTIVQPKKMEDYEQNKENANEEKPVG